MFLAFIAWLALIALLLWINSLGRAMRDWMDADRSQAGEGLIRKRFAWAGWSIFLTFSETATDRNTTWHLLRLRR